MSAREGIPKAARRGTLQAGTALAPVAYETSTVQVFRYSAATWNTHRIHYDREYARAEGYPDVLVQSHLHGALLARYATGWAGEEGRLTELALRVRRYAVAGETLTVSGVVTAVSRLARERAELTLSLAETRSCDGETCVSGEARIEVPADWLAEMPARGEGAE
ncbi:MAG: MaoC family dehydratase N-terminal domain-containing protein [Solirubrobacteraceae bacterium]